MGHTTNCETANDYKCVCPCGGALHGAVLIRGVSSTDAGAQDEAFTWADPKRWTHASAATKQSTVEDKSSDRRPAMTAVVSELVLTIIEEVRKEGQLDAVEVLARKISEEIGDEFERHLDGGGPDCRSNRHLWCVVLATICRLYDHTATFARRSVEELVDGAMKLLKQDASADRGEQTQARDVYWYRRRIVAAFDVDKYDFLGALVKRAIRSVMAAMKQIGEVAVMKYLRLIASITCPDPDRHPDVVKYCIWPLLLGPFRELLKESIATEMRIWLRNAYVSVPRA